jgi:hypothetical protein
MVGWDEKSNRGTINDVHKERWVEHGTFSMDPKRFDVTPNRPLESSAVGRKLNSDEGLKSSDELSTVKARTVRNQSWVI